MSNENTTKEFEAIKKTLYGKKFTLQHNKKSYDLYVNKMREGDPMAILRYGTTLSDLVKSPKHKFNITLNDANGGVVKAWTNLPPKVVMRFLNEVVGVEPKHKGQAPSKFITSVNSKGGDKVLVLAIPKPTQEERKEWTTLEGLIQGLGESPTKEISDLVKSKVLNLGGSLNMNEELNLDGTFNLKRNNNK